MVKIETPDEFLEGWPKDQTLPPSFHAYAWRVYRAMLELEGELATRPEGAASSEPSATIESAEPSFIHHQGIGHTPTILLRFAKDDWKSRDAIVRWLRGRLP